MDQIVALARVDVNELTERISSLQTKEICSYLEKAAIKRSENFVELLSALFKGLPCSTEPRIEKRKSVYRKALGLLQRERLPKAVTVDIFEILVSETNGFPALTLVDLSTEFIDDIKNGEHPPGRWIELYPQILSCVAAQEKVLSQGEYLSGEDYKSQIIGELCSIRWPKAYVNQMIIMLKEIVLTVDELEMIFEKILRLLPELEHVSVPSVVYQMLALSVKGPRRQMLNGLFEFFSKQEAKAKKIQEERDAGGLDIEETEFGEDLFRCEGTSLVHCLFAMNYDKDLGKELLNLVQANRFLPEKIFSPFPFALALAGAGVDKLRPLIFECLKTAFVRHSKEVVLRKNVHWMRKMTGQAQTFSAEEAIALVVTRSVGGWDCVLEALVDFAFFLLDAFGVKAGGSGKDRAAVEMVCALATDVVLRIFKSCSTSRQSIAKKVFNRIKPTTSSATFVGILAKTVRLIPHAFLDSSGSDLVRNLLDNLTQYPVATARDALAAVRPLLELNPSLQDAVVLSLRKAMFSKQVDGRLIAVVGFLACLNHVHPLGSLVTVSAGSSSQTSMASSSSQVHASMHVPRNLSIDQGLGLELLGMLQRSLSQQAEVRTMFYQGLPSVILKNPHLTTGALDLLLQHGHIFVEPGNVPPFNLDSCVRLQGPQVLLLEPLPHLLRCASQCLEIAKAKHDRQDAHLDNEEMAEVWNHPLMVVLKESAAALAKLDLEDFSLDKATEFNLNVVAGAKKVAHATLLLGIYETLMEFVYLFDSYSPESANQVTLLFECHRKLSSLLREKGAVKKAGTKGRKKNDGDDSVVAAKADAAVAPAQKNLAFEFKHVFSDKFLVKILSDLRNDVVEEHQEALDMLRDVPSFEQLLINIATQRVNDFHVGGSAAGAEEGFRFCTSIGLLFFRRYSAAAVAMPANKKAAEIAVKLKFLEGFVAAVTVVTENYSKQLPSFLNALVSPTGDPNNMSLRNSQSQPNVCDGSLHDVLGTLKGMVTTSLDNNDALKFKELGCLLRAISLLVDGLEPDSVVHESATKWVNTLSTKNALDDAAIAKSLVSLLSALSLQSPKHMMLLLRFCEDVHIALDDIDEEVDLDKETQYSIVTAGNAPAVIQVVLQHLDAAIINVSWVVAGARSKFITKQSSSLLSEKKTKQLCDCFAHVAEALLELLQTKFSVGPCIEQTVKLASRFYVVIAELTKYQLAACGIPNIDLSAYFQKIIGSVNSNLTPYVYMFVAYVNNLVKTTDCAGKKLASRVSDKKLEKMMGMMVFNLEKFESFVLQLEKKSKVTLTRQMKLNTNRDFKIDLSVIRDKLSKLDSEEEEEVTAEVTMEDNCELPIAQTPETTPQPRKDSATPPTKRFRLSGNRSQRSQPS